MSDNFVDTLSAHEDSRMGIKSYTRKIDEVNPSLRYIGESASGGVTSSAYWRIRREITQGSVTTISYASTQFNQIWDNRANLSYNGSGASSFNNTLSTLFDGINDYCTAGKAFNYEHSQQFTCSLWVKPNNFAAVRVMGGNVNGAVDGWRILHDTSGRLQSQTRSPGGAYASTTYTDLTMTALAWNHVVFKWLGGSNNNQGRMYLNGVLSAITPSVGSLTTTWLATNELQFGRGPANYFVGNIDEITLWDKALSDAEVLSLYNAGVPSDPSLVSFSANLKNWYRMGDGDTFPIIFDQITPSEDMTCTNMVDSATNFVVDTP